MSRAPAIFILLMTIAVIAFFAVDAYFTRTGKLPPEELFAPLNPQPGTLPRDALQLSQGVLPDSIMFNFVTARDDAARADAASLWQNYWLPDEGWKVTIEEVKPAFDKLELRCWINNPSVVGGGYVLIAETIDDGKTIFSPRMQVTLFGRIARLQREELGGLPSYSMFLEESTVLR